ncbi:hypothetical protein BJV82DRAFT_511449 [Fennellomyces sp. T-0311]|nr:hypothetical protein BJV82DRAFT_511449 [Fennellomyces sp. T-0311]
MKKLPNLERQGSAQGTRADHFWYFVNSVIQILKEQQQLNLYFILEDPSDSRDQKVIGTIKKAKHRVLLIPLKSSLFNPSRPFWEKVKASIKRTPLGVNDNLAMRMTEAVESVSQNDCQSWVDECIKNFADYSLEQ